MCWEAKTGKEVWKSRLGGTFNASLVLVGDQIFATNQEGPSILKASPASPTKFELIGEDVLGDDVYATPVVCSLQSVACFDRWACQFAARAWRTGAAEAARQLESLAA